MCDFKRRDYPELNFTVVAEVEETIVYFRIYEIEGIKEDGSILWHKSEAGSYPNPVEFLADADVFCHGEVKWDGCSNWCFDEQDRAMLHGCDRRDLMCLGRILAKCWDMAAELCPRWDQEVADV